MKRSAIPLFEGEDRRSAAAWFPSAAKDQSPAAGLPPQADRCI